KISGFRQCPLDDPLAVLQQRIEIVDQWLHLGRIDSFNPFDCAVPQTKQLSAQPAERQQSLPKLPDSRGYAKCRKAKKNSCAPSWQETMKLTVRYEEQQMHYRDQSERPENCTEDNSPSERLSPLHGCALMRYPRFRTVSMNAGPSFRLRRA